jgi:hypothetical protein
MYEQIALSLSPGQLKKILGHNGVGTVTLRLSNTQLKGDGHSLKVTKTIANRIKKCADAGKGCQVALSSACLKCNRKGGFLSALAGLLTKIGVDDVSRIANSESEGRRKIRSRLEVLRGNSGNGVSKTPRSKSYMDGYEYAQKYGSGILSQFAPELLKSGLDNLTTAQRKQLVNVLTGLTGQKGAGFLNDFADGFIEGFTRPLSSIEHLVREADTALSGSGAELSGGGVTFY